MVRTLRIFGACFVVLMTACGGGGSSDQEAAPFGAATLSGSYALIAYSGSATFWGSAEFDGVSVVALTTDANNSGVITSQSSSLDYAVGADGTLSLFRTGAESGRGGVARDGSCAVASSTQAGLPLIFVFLRKGSGLTNASADGAFGISGFAIDDTDAGAATDSQGESLFGDGMFGAPNEFLFDVDTNENGLFVPFGPFVGFYDVAADGTFDFLISLGIGVLDFKGSISEESSCVVLGGSLDSGSRPQLFALARQGSGMSNASWQGDYWMVGVEATPPGDAFLSFGALLTASGDGNWNMVGRRTDFLATTSDFSDAATYSVAADGSTTFVRGSDTLVGQVSPDGKYVVLGGAGNDSGVPLIWIGCRR